MKYTDEQRLEYAKSITDEHPGIKIHDTAIISRTCDIGGDGFGYAREADGSLVRMPHRGGVIIEKGVVIREFVTVDRAVNGNTTIGMFTAIDHHCHIAHGAQIGWNNTFANGCCIEGSCEIGDFNTFGAMVVIQRKVKIGSWCIFGSGAVVTKDVDDYSIMVGNPAKLLRKNG